jgi:Glutathione synthase/Ribosomal protein S6 modification enzyme (glutaminyl transferase)
MVLIISELFDQATDTVVRWLRKRNRKYIRINSFTELIKLGISIHSSEKFETSSIGKHNISEVKSVWFRRRPEFSNKDKLVKSSFSQGSSIAQEMNSSLIYEELVVNNFFESLLENSRVIGNVKNSSLNKMYQLKVAAKLGMLIPDSAVLTCKDDLRKFIKKHTKVIIKPLNNIAFVRQEGVTYSTYTKIVNETIFDRIPEKFSPALFQRLIDKEFEIRSFYLNEEEYSMAIFSQKNNKTMVDFRKYDHEYPNRRVPFTLPKQLNEKIKHFMKIVGINTGSFDFIYSTAGEYIFLEVNPVGQFGMVSIPCNYYIERHIAETLSKC